MHHSVSILAVPWPAQGSSWITQTVIEQHLCAECIQMTSWRSTEMGEEKSVPLSDAQRRKMHFNQTAKPDQCISNEHILQISEYHQHLGRSMGHAVETAQHLAVTLCKSSKLGVHGTDWKLSWSCWPLFLKRKRFRMIFLNDFYCKWVQFTQWGLKVAWWLSCCKGN